MDNEITLYTNPWSRGAIAHWMLEEVGAPYRIEVLDYEGQMKTPQYLAINPMGKVPAIVHGQRVVTETAAICAYLADAFPQAGLAPRLADRAAYYRWLFFGAGPMETALSLSGCDFEPTPEQQMQLGYGTKAQVLDTLAKALKGRRYIAGDTFSAADVYVGSFVGWSMQFGTIDKRPEFVAYWDGLKDRPAHQRVEAQIAEMAPPPDAQASSQG